MNKILLKEGAGERLLSALEAFELLGLAPSSAWALLKAGRIPRPIKIGRRSKWSQRALEQWIEEQHQAAQAAARQEN